MSATPDPSMKMDFDTSVKLNIYEAIARTTRAPTSAEVAAALSASPEEVEAAFERLHQKRLLVPEPGDPSRIRMAPPFSGVETPFRVKVQDKVYYANCAWDPQATDHQSQSAMGSGDDVVRESPDGRVAPAGSRRDGEDLCAHWPGR